MRKLIVIIIITILLVGCSNEKSFVSINYSEALNLISEEQVMIIDVRSVDEYETGHIKDSINIPVDTIKLEVIEQVITSKWKNIIVYCRSGNRSKQAAQILVDLGYTNVFDLGSITNWNGEIE